MRPSDCLVMVSIKATIFNCFSQARWFFHWLIAAPTSAIKPSLTAMPIQCLQDNFRSALILKCHVSIFDITPSLNNLTMSQDYTLDKICPIEPAFLFFGYRPYPSRTGVCFLKPMGHGSSKSVKRNGPVLMQLQYHDSSKRLSLLSTANCIAFSNNSPFMQCGQSAFSGLVWGERVHLVSFYFKHIFNLKSIRSIISMFCRSMKDSRCRSASNTGYAPSMIQAFVFIH